MDTDNIKTYGHGISKTKTVEGYKKMNVYTQTLSGERVSETLETIYAIMKQTPIPYVDPEEPYWVHEVKEDQTTLKDYFS